MRTGTAVIAFVVSMAGAASAQTLFQGRIDVTVQDSQGSIIPGALVEIAGPWVQNQTTDAEGQAHFLNLPPGQYTVNSSLSGFTPSRINPVAVAAGTAVPLKVTLQVSGVAEAVQVVAETPIVDPARQTITTSVSFDELQRIPTARDPWVVLQTVPGVIVDRVNVGGAESGQQSNFIAKGASGAENTWNLDGIPVTDLASTGSSPTYYNFDMFEEMSVTTGGASATNPTPGVQLNMQFKTGGDQIRGAAHYYGTGEGLQANNLPDELLPLAGPTGKGNRMKELSDGGFDLGGPILRSRWWAWGSYGLTDSTLYTLNGDPDKTRLENIAFKTSAQVTPNIRPEFLYFRGNKEKNGRGASPLRDPATTWDQTGPTPLYKGQVNFTVGNTLFLTARAGYVGNGFSLTPQGGLAATAYRDPGRVRRGSYVFYETDRPDKSALGDGTWFKGRHEIAFGGSWRNVRDDERQEWPGSGVDNLQAADYATSGTIQAWLYRPFFASSELSSQSLYVGDTWRTGRMTTQLSLRYDRSSASMLESRQAANPGFPELLPAIVAPAESDLIQASLLSPRVGVSYRLDDVGRTVARASYGMFGTQIGSGTVQSFSAASQAILIYSATDTNHNNVADPGELNQLLTYAGVDPANPAAGINFNRVDPNFKAPRTHELVVGLDHELMPQFAIGGSFTWRRFTNLIWSSVDLVAQQNVYPLIGLTSADYALEGTASGTAPGIGNYSRDFYAPIESSLPPGNGVEFRNRPDYHQTYMGFELQATKRLANRWMGRVAFSSNSHTEHFDGPAAIQDPGATTSWPNIQGGAYITSTTGSGKSEIYLILPRYQLAASGMYQMPWGINLAGNLVSREGFGKPYFETVESADPTLPEKRVLLVNPQDQRLDAATTFDLRLEKAFHIGRNELSVSGDVFNLFNASTVLGRQYDVTATGTTGFDQPLEVMNPRILRLGVRWLF